MGVDIFQRGVGRNRMYGLAAPWASPAVAIHSHGDGMIHIHPFSPSGADRATVGLYLSQAGDEVDKDSIKLADGTDVTNGDPCPNLDNQPARVRWTVNGKEQAKGTDPSRYVPVDGNVLAIAFLPPGMEIGVPPQAFVLPGDVPGMQPRAGATPPVTAQ
jgi:hypothetical protein